MDDLRVSETVYYAVSKISMYYLKHDYDKLHDKTIVMTFLMKILCAKAKPFMCRMF